MAIVETNNLTKIYGGKFTAVDHISFQVQEGEIFGFLGPNGAGKTTTVHMLCTLTQITEGEAKIAGIDVKKQPDEVRKKIGLVPQDISVDDELTAKENMELHGKLYHMPKNLIQQRIPELLQVVELTEWQNTLVKKFSGGMRRRLEIAEGLMHRPDILFLDEPTLGLDPASRASIWEYVRKLNEEGITIFMTTHYMDEADKLCDRIAIIDYGKIVGIGSPQELKGMLGGDVVTVHANDREKFLSHIKTLDFVTEVLPQENGIRLTVDRGETAIPKLFQEASRIGVGINNISLSRPTLDDVFIKFTGRSLREEKADRIELFKRMMLMQRRRRQ
ncbi:MAG: ATP-binding cassette domain-containing protein [Candidatus Freyarchaeota archaeon]|nr:ATP-binding cassette domain-containing protein [Candidatus Jordarchaeia archaeon]MBS7269087.1 ATP-binding cassette domain-containing protein [Candidatus Jordarchaeia archaeon]MBS7280708.1 ATP-binding cassette domain-containing protein [Candidatus Jordarchaeia archaeon]